MPRRPQNRYHHGNIEAASIAAALRLLQREGPRALTLRRVAAAVGVSPAAPYRHFASKQELLAAIAAAGFAELADAMARAAAGAGRDVGERSLRQGIAYVNFAVAHPGLFRVMFGPEVSVCKGHPGVPEAGARAFLELLQTVRVAQAAGWMRAGNPEDLATSAWALIHGLAGLVVDGWIPDDPQIIERTIRHVQRLLQAEPGRTRKVARPAASRAQRKKNGL
jgi:AcrR family transcriptional regulator